MEPLPLPHHRDDFEGDAELYDAIIERVGIEYAPLKGEQPQLADDIALARHLVEWGVLEERIDVKRRENGIPASSTILFRRHPVLPFDPVRWPCGCWSCRTENGRYVVWASCDRDVARIGSVKNGHLFVPASTSWEELPAIRKQHAH